MKKQNLFLLTWKRLWLIIVIGFIGIILHNVISALFSIEEAFFFILVVIVIPIYFLVCLIYSIVYWVFLKKKTKKKRGHRSVYPKSGSKGVKK
jgi:hypothetical protein